ncbi:MAG: PIN domain-containing protein [Nitrospinae bacterium]|nr:PIN domain-containing protein [Nitrospinota bacterium]
MSAKKAIIDTSVILRLLTRDDEAKSNACQRLIRESGRDGITLILPFVAALEIVWVLEKVYKYDRRRIRDIVDAILNTPELKVEQDSVIRKAVYDYAEKNVKFADAVMAHSALENGVSAVYTYDEKDFRKIKGVEPIKP